MTVTSTSSYNSIVMRSSSRSRWILCGVLLLVAAAGLIGLLQYTGWSLASLRPGHIREFVLSFGAWAPAAYLVLYGQPIMPLPASVLMMAGGLAFGPTLGLVMALSAATIRAGGQFGLARWLGRDALTRLLRGRAALLDHYLGDHGFRTVLLIRLIPNFPCDIQNFGLGCSRVKFVPYILATLVGLLPIVWAFVSLGDTIAGPRRFWQAIGVLIALIALGVVRLLRRRPSGAVAPMPMAQPAEAPRA